MMHSAILPSHTYHPDVLIPMDEAERAPYTARARSAGTALRRSFGAAILKGRAAELDARVRSAVDDPAFQALLTELSRASFGALLNGEGLEIDRGHVLDHVGGAFGEPVSAEMSRLLDLVEMSGQTLASVVESQAETSAEVSDLDVEAMPGPREMMYSSMWPLELVSCIYAGMTFVARMVAIGAATGQKSDALGMKLVLGARADFIENSRLLTLIPGARVPTRLVPRSRRLSVKLLERQAAQRQTDYEYRADDAAAYFADD